ncbi:MAG TPA: putative porin [bacterium]
MEFSGADKWLFGGQVGVRFAPTRNVTTILLGDYVENRGFNRNDVARRTGNADLKEATTGYHVSLSVGHEKTTATGDWRLGLAYKRLEADAVIDAFTESDFHLGGTNAEGWILLGQLGLGEKARLCAT